MAKVVSIDPGKRNVGYAVWTEDGTLLDAGLVNHEPEPGDERAQQWKEISWWVALATGIDKGEEILLVCEIPQVYEGFSEKDKNDLVDLSGVVGAIAARICCGRVEWSPKPREWKGQLPKEISQKRVESKLSDAEKALVKWPSKDLKHNVYDALHLGLTYFEREGIRLPRT